VAGVLELAGGAVDRLHGGEAGGKEVQPQAESPNGKSKPGIVPVIVLDAVSITATLPLPASSWETQAVAPAPLSAIETGCANPEIAAMTVLVAVEITDLDLAPADFLRLRGRRRTGQVNLDQPGGIEVVILRILRPEAASS
jgi:hypothetical protein